MVNPITAEHVVVYRDDSEYAGWPANGGFWNFGDDEFVVGFIRNKCTYKDLNDTRHSRIQWSGGQHVTVRSQDGGRTWPTEGLQVLVNNKLELRWQLMRESQPDFPEYSSILPKAKPVDFANPGVAMATEVPLGREEGPTAYFLTRDCGHIWEGPHVLPTRGEIPIGRGQALETIHARPAYIRRSDGAVLLFVNGGYGREANLRPLALASYDGGVEWRFLSYLTPKDQTPVGIMPAPALLPDGRIVVALRRLWPEIQLQWTEIVSSDDNGLTWCFLSRVNEWGAPAHLLVLRDGRLLCTYGRRVPPYGIRTKISEDGGESWGTELIIRDDGGSWDVGYPRTALRNDGKVIAVYYINKGNDVVNCCGGVRHISASIFEV